MYNSASILKLIDRIGWSPAIQPSSIVISSANSKSDSGRFFNSFNALATVENVAAVIPQKNVSTPDFQAFIEKMKKDAVLQMLNKVYDLNPLANYESQNRILSLNYAEDYSEVILSRPGLFDEAIGAALAVRFLQLALTTSRSNGEERIIGVNYSKLKGELEGFYDPYGRLIGNGAIQVFDKAVSDLIAILFPVKAPGKTLTSKPWW